MSYYRDRKYNNSETLKPYDIFAKKIPVTYAEGCIRHIAEPLNRVFIDEAPHFGHIVTNSEYETTAKNIYCLYKMALAVETLLTIYGDEDAFPEQWAEVTPEIADEILMRFYPYNYNWVISDDSRGYVIDRVLSPREFHEELNDILSSDPKKRKKYLHFTREECVTKGNIE